MSDYFAIGENYSRKLIWDILLVPENKRKGNWYTGYHKYNGDWFIFCGLNTPGRTGHNYHNKFVGDDMEWYGDIHSNLAQPSIQSLIYPSGNVFLFTREDSNNPQFIYRGKGKAKQWADTTPAKIIWEFCDNSEQHPEKLPEEVYNSETYPEGSTKAITVNIYERNPDARLKCITHYGLSCSVCGFSFVDRYGDIGKYFIHVHHLIALHEIKEKYEVDPILDLRPVCPNCHAMLHRKRPAYSIEDLKAIMKIKDQKPSLST